MTQQKKIYILMGGSGAGKTTLGEHLKEMGLPEMVSHSTGRGMRKGEVEGVTYYFVTKEEYDQIEKIEWTEYPKDSGKFYCLSKKEVETKLEKQGKVFAITDVNGVRQIKEKYPNETEVIYIHIPFEKMAERMRARGDSEEAIQERLFQAKVTGELQNHKYADHIIENIDLEESKKKIRDIVFAS